MPPIPIVPKAPNLALTVRVIDHCGGPSAVARHLKIRPQAVVQWRKHGVPAKRMTAVVAFARRAGFVVQAADLRPDIFPRT